MSIAGRLAFETGGEDDRTGRAIGYHGIDVLVTDLSTEGFLADIRAAVPVGARVRLRLPGLGAAHARVCWSQDGALRAEFANPVGFGRLVRIPGFTRLSRPAASAA